MSSSWDNTNPNAKSNEKFVGNCQLIDVEKRRTETPFLRFEAKAYFRTGRKIADKMNMIAMFVPKGRIREYNRIMAA